ncbi:MAG: MFS transporter [Desulfobacterales bacterium]|nr:MAG: MFS transporter [Desulfobacterales bacterium]
MHTDTQPNSGNRQSAFAIPNIRRYIAFKVLFNSRFYYPVFTILFLDFGLSVAQFSILNAVWAATIVLAEVPSGALADTIGRKRLLVFATLTMVVEVGLIAFVPAGNSTLVFWIFFINRVLSGLAEAAASGADEALAYDALKTYGDPTQWGRVLEVLTRYQSVGFIIAMTLGAAIYDPALMSTLAQGLGIGITLTQETCMRFPLYGTLILGIGACIATMGMEEMSDRSSKDAPEKTYHPHRLTEAFALTFKAGRWILSTPFVLGVILFGMLFDSSIRMVITLSSQYYRMILLPESIFGIIGAGVAVLGFFIPALARKLAENKPPEWGLYLTASLTTLGLISMNFFWTWFGIIPALITYSAMYFNGFFVSFYINRETPSAQRATVLSFKGLSYNLAYGLYGIIYALVLKIEHQRLDTRFIDTAIDNLAFKESFFIFPTLFILGFICLWVVSKSRLLRVLQQK